MKYCMKCGTPSADEMLFCAACGYKFAEQTQQQAAPVRDEYESVAPQYVPVMQQPMQTAEPAQTQPYYEQQPVYMNPQEDIATPVPKKRKVWLWSLLSVVLVAAIGVSAWYFLLHEKKDTKATISEAVFASVEELEDLYDDGANFDAFVDAIRSFDTSEVRLSLEMEGLADGTDDDIIQGIRVIMEVNRSKQAQLTSGNVLFELSNDENKADIELVYAINEEMTQFALPGLLDDVYCIRENIFEDMGLGSLEGVLESENTPSMKETREIFDRLVDSIQTETITEKTYALSGKRVVCEIHTITYDQTVADELNEYLFGEMMSLFEDVEFEMPKMENIQLIVRDDTCIGIIFDSQIDDEITNYQLILGGDKNPWSDIYCYTDGEESLRICTTTNEDGFVVESTADGETSKITVIDSERKIIVEPADEESQEIYFAVEDSKISLSAEMEEFCLTISMEGLTQLPTMLSEDLIDINELDDDERMDLLEKLVAAIKDNPEFAWLLEDSYTY